jgi:hypothetical protein
MLASYITKLVIFYDKDIIDEKKDKEIYTHFRGITKKIDIIFLGGLNDEILIPPIQKLNINITEDNKCIIQNRGDNKYNNFYYLMCMINSCIDYCLVHKKKYKLPNGTTFIDTTQYYFTRISIDISSDIINTLITQIGKLYDPSKYYIAQEINDFYKHVLTSLKAYIYTKHNPIDTYVSSINTKQSSTPPPTPSLRRDESQTLLQERDESETPLPGRPRTATVWEKPLTITNPID